MNNKIQISASIVLYKEDIQILKSTVKSFLQIPLRKKLFLIDNSPTNKLIKLFKHPEIEFVFNNKNIGFGKAHNKVLEKINSDYHLILNPDVTFNPNVFNVLIKQFEKDKKISMISPKVISLNGETQFTCRKNPTIKEIISRRIVVFKKNRKDPGLELSKPFYPEFIHGCFMLFKTPDFVKLKGFDERYFLYMEDADICREIKQSGKEILYYPEVKITHIHRKGSSKKIKLLFYHILSAIKYFRKWK